ncbi:MAG: enoyl-CoA hydratase/isomerase family protein [Chloroflexi bacterium]|nr:enoyl-CoA hydratase/isomerase family protein [Chloroflexota bacterium]
MEFVSLERVTPAVGLLRVVRPQSRNALNWQAQNEFVSVIREASEDRQIKVLLITGSGRSFLSGGDLIELNDFSQREDGLRLSTMMGDGLAYMRATGLLSLAVINGYARGGGAEVALWCSQRWMAADADIAFVHSRLGLAPGWGGGNQLAELVGAGRAADLLASARVVSADEAGRIGLAEHVFAQEELLDRALEYAEGWANATVGERRLPAGGSQPDARMRRKQLKERVEFLRLWDREERREKFRQFAE